MGTWQFVNNTNAPVNVGLYWGGFLTGNYKNDLPPYSAATIKALGLDADTAAWEQAGIKAKLDAQGNELWPDTCAISLEPDWGISYDILVSYSVPGAELTPKDNWERGVAVGMTGVGILLTAAGLALSFIPVVGEALDIAGVEIATVEGVAVLMKVGTAVGWTGAAVTGVSLAADIAAMAMRPGQWHGWDGGKDYVCVVNGGFESTRNADNSVTVTGAKPLSLHWVNVDNGTSGDSASA